MKTREPSRVSARPADGLPQVGAAEGSALMGSETGKWKALVFLLITDTDRNQRRWHECLSSEAVRFGGW